MALKVLSIGILLLAGFSAWSVENIRPFNSDGCSFSPDSFQGKSFVHCCMEHDIAYYAGGLHELKVKADQKLNQCIVDAGAGDILGELYEFGVSVGGKPTILGLKNKAHYVWGYGFEKPRGYAPLNPDQRNTLVKNLFKVKEDLESDKQALANNLYDWRYRGLKISKEQFDYFESALNEKISLLYNEHINTHNNPGQ